SDEILQVLCEAESRLLELNLEHLVEVKPAAVALHWSSLDNGEVLVTRTEAQRVLESLAYKPGLLLAEVEGGIEIRVRSAKGDAIRTILSEIPDGTAIAYVGPTIDPDAKRLLESRGVMFTDERLKEITRFLQEWIGYSAGSAPAQC